MPSAVVRLICPNLRCKSILAVPGEARGKTVRCRGCGTRVRIPLTPKPASPATAETAEEETTQ
jgi:hypothetical protein